MKVTQGEVEERQVTLRIELDDDDLEPYVERGYRQVVGKMRIPGFRPGKAPRRIVEGMMGRESLISESLEFMVADTISKAVEEQGIESVGFPQIENVEFDPVVVEAAVALNPILDLGDYKSIRVEEDPVEVSDEDIEDELEALRKQQSSWEPVDRAVALDDLVTMDVTGRLNGVEIIDETDSQYLVDPSSTLPFSGFAAELEGLEVDNPAEFTLDVPDDYPDNEIAGKQVEFSVTISDVKQRLLPELDDEFAQSVRDECETLDDLREQIRENIQDATLRQNEHEYRELAIEELVVNADVEIAPLLVQHEIDHMEERREEMMKRLGISEEDYNRFTGKTADQIRDEMREEAVEKLNRSHAISAFVEQEALEISDDELNDRLKQLAREGDESTGRKLTNKELRSERVKSSVRESLLIEKALDRLVLIAKGQADEESGEDSSPEEDRPERARHEKAERKRGRTLTPTSPDTVHTNFGRYSMSAGLARGRETKKASFVVSNVEFVDADYQASELKEFLNRPKEELESCEAFGGIDHGVTIRYPVEVDGESHKVKASIYFTECDDCGAVPLDERGCFYSCETCGEDDDVDDGEEHGTDGWQVFESAISAT